MKVVIHGRQGEPFQAGTPVTQREHSAYLKQGIAGAQDRPHEMQESCLQISQLYRGYITVFLQVSLSDDLNQVVTAFLSVF